MTKEKYIELLRNNDFNVFPIPENTKVADTRYQAERTVVNQVIRENENYGYIPIKEKHNTIIDLDDKEKYRSFAEHMIKKGYMVTESPHGWHIPVVGLANDATKIELFDYDYQDKKIIEVQGVKHYCVGIGCKIKDDVTNEILSYENKGTDVIWNAKGNDFNTFIDELCKQCKVTPRKRGSRNTYLYYRQKFLKGETPTQGTSNDFFHQAALQCNTDQLTQGEAIEKIRIAYDKWAETKAYSARAWSNIEAKIKEVYENDDKVYTGRPQGSKNKIDRTKIAEEICANRLLYSNDETEDVFENKNGFLEKINHSLKKEIYSYYPEMESTDYNQILWKIVSGSPDLPETNKDLVSFKDGKFNQESKKFPVESEDIADLGFKDYNYLKPLKKNEPKRFLEVLFDNIHETEWPRVKAGLRAILQNYLDPKISVLHGTSRVGKTTVLLILVKVLGNYALPVELYQLVDDNFIKAQIIGKRLVVIQDLPRNWKDLVKLKAITGENRKTERGFHRDAEQFDNKIKIWASANYLAKIPEYDKDNMYTGRLSLVHNIRQQPYPENRTLIDDIVKEEGEKIISWILNLKDEECQYEDSKTVRKEWESLANPEAEYIEKHYQIGDTETDYSIMTLIKQFKKDTGKYTDIKLMTQSLVEQGFVIKWNLVKNLLPIDQKQESEILA